MHDAPPTDDVADALEMPGDTSMFGNWLAGPADDAVLITPDGRFTRGRVRRRIRALIGAIERHPRSGLVVVVGGNDDEALCAYVAAQLCGRVATVIDTGTSDAVIGALIGSLDVDVVVAASSRLASLGVGGATIASDEVIDGLVVVGHSWGGVVATLIADRATQAGWPVRSVVLVDSSPAARAPRLALLRRGLSSLRGHVRPERSAGPPGAVHTPTASDGERTALSALGDQRFLDHIAAIRAVRPTPVSAPGLLICAGGAEQAVDVEPWRPLFPSGLTVVTVPGGHTSVLAEPFLGRVVELVGSAAAP